MNLNEKVQELKSKTIEEQAKERTQSDSMGCLCALVGLVIAIIYAASASSHSAISPGFGFVIFLGLGIAIGAIVYKNRNDRIDTQYNQIIRDAQVEMKRRRETKVAAEKKARTDAIDAIYGTNRKTIDFSNKFNTRQIIINEEKELIRICEKDLTFADIINFKVTDDTKDIYTPATYETKTNTGSMVGRAVVGGILTGGVGAIIGGATAKKETVQTKGGTHRKSHDYRVHVYLNNINDPQLEIRLFSDAKTTEEIAGVLTYIINKNEEKKQDSSNKEVAPQQTSNSVADELAKLAELKNQGILTEEEFVQQKKKILGI